jgi:hypothetical protein
MPVTVERSSSPTMKQSSGILASSRATPLCGDKSCPRCSPSRPSEGHPPRPVTSSAVPPSAAAATTTPMRTTPSPTRNRWAWLLAQVFRADPDVFAGAPEGSELALRATNFRGRALYADPAELAQISAGDAPGVVPRRSPCLRRSRCTLTGGTRSCHDVRRAKLQPSYAQ